MITYKKLEDGALVGNGNSYISHTHRFYKEALELVEYGKAEIIPYTVPVPTKSENQHKKNQESLSYLNSTDWYIVRMSETNVKVPDNILKARAAARIAVKEV